MASVVGIDVGLVLHKATSGICKSGDDGFELNHTFTDRLSRESAIQFPNRIDLLAIDGPVLAAGQINYQIRAVEKVFLWSPFKQRCAIGDTRRGIGAALRRGGCDTASQFADPTRQSICTTVYPKIQKDRHVVEAFPNAFLGVMLPAEAYPSPMPKFKRGGKFEWLLERWRGQRLDREIRKRVPWPDKRLWSELQTNTHHEEQAGLLCALTAACIIHNQYVAVGEPLGGYIFLPPWALWADWAKSGLRQNRTDRRLMQMCHRQVDVWMNGTQYAPGQALPA